MPPDGFVVINEGGRPPTPNRNNRIPPPPPNHPRAPQGGGIPPRVINAAPHPAELQQVQRQPPQPHSMPPQHHHHPLVVQPDPPVRISDIRKERLTPDQAREELSDYIIYRFEPSQRVSDYDDGLDVDRKPNWESVLVMEVRGVSKKEAARQVKHLNQTTWSLGDKKASLSGAQQRQIEKVLEELQARDHPLFQTNLVQISHQFKTTKVKVKAKHDKHHHKYGSKHSKEISLLFRDHKHHHKKSSSKDKKKPKASQERISLTAYYKRSPKPELDALAIYHQREAHFRRLVNPPPPPMMAPAPEGAHHHHHPPPEGGPGKPGGGGNAGGGGGGGGGGGWNGNKGQPGKGGGPVATVVRTDNRKGGGRANSRSPPGSPYSSSSDRSFFSETFSMDDDMSTITPNSDSSSQDSRRRGSFHRHRPRKERPYRLEGPMHFGIRHPSDHYRGRRAGEVHRITDDFLPPMALPVPQLVQPVVPIEQIEQIKSDAFEAGRAQERADVERIADKIAMATVAAVQPPPRPPSPEFRLPPRRLQHRPSIRVVRPGEISHEEATLERLERLDMRDEALEEYRYTSTLAAGPGRRRHPRRDEVWEEEHYRLPPRRRPLDEAMDHIRRTDAGIDIPYMDNPFAPMPEEVGRRRGTSPDPYYNDYR